MMVARRAWALVVLTSCLFGALSPALALHADLDRECGEAAWATPHHPTTQVEQARPSPHGDHCSLCHLQRVVRMPARSADARAGIDTPARIVTSPVWDASGRLVGADVPARAPPA